MDQRNGSVASGQLRRVAIPDGSLPACFGTAATSKIWARPVGSHRRLREFTGARYGDGEHARRTSCADAGFSDFSGWAKPAILSLERCRRGSRKWDFAVQALGRPFNPYKIMDLNLA